MNTKSKNKGHIGLAIFFVILFTGCIPKAKTLNPFPENGELCFQTSGLPATEYIHMEFEGKSVTGKLYLEDENWGGYFIDFTGTLSSDTTMLVQLALNDVHETEAWNIHLADNKMTLENSLKRAVLAYDVTDCNRMPDSEKYLSIRQMAEADQAENGVSLFCYESASSDAYKRSTLHEYIVFWSTDETVTGNGSGYDEGGPEWNFTFSGAFTNDSTIDVTVNYTYEGAAPFASTETWVIDGQNDGMRLKKPVRDRPGAKAYFRIDPEDIPEAFGHLLQNH